MDEFSAPSSPVAVPPAGQPESVLRRVDFEEVPAEQCKHRDLITLTADTGRRKCYDCGEEVPPAVPPVEAATVERNDMNPFGMDLRGSCCVDAMNVGDEGTLHTGGCPNRCSVVTKFDMPPGGYACALAVGHAGDHWIHPLYRTEAAPIPSSHTDGTAAPAAVYEVAARAFMSNVPKTRHNHWDDTMRWQRDNRPFRRAVDAVWAAALSHVQAETAAAIAKITEERDLAIAHDTQPYPTADAYNAACAALHKHRERADKAEAEIRDLHETKLVEAHHEIERLGKALRVCEHVLSRAEPSDAQLHAGQQAAGAYVTEWLPDDVFDDLPDFEYPSVDQLAEWREASRG